MGAWLSIMLEGTWVFLDVAQTSPRLECPEFQPVVLGVNVVPGIKLEASSKQGLCPSFLNSHWFLFESHMFIFKRLSPIVIKKKMGIIAYFGDLLEIIAKPPKISKANII